MGDPLRVLCLSAYDAASHRRWYEQLTQGLPQFHWQVLNLPPRHFRWRIRGNPLSWLHEPALQQHWDLILATSMVDLSTLRGLHPRLAQVPAVVYCHENQFQYPDRRGPQRSAEPAMVNLYATLAADRVLFNSAWNRDSFVAGVHALMNRLPDCQPDGLADTLHARAEILPVPLEDAFFEPTASTATVDWQEDGESPLRIVWAARWEYDKGPERLLAILRQLEQQGVAYRLCLLGERFRQTPDAFERICEEFPHRLVQVGYEPERARYRAWLASGHLVLSTSLHEFQGLAVLEAVASGCVPVMPDRLVYPEHFTGEYLYASHLDDVEREAAAAADGLTRLGRQVLAGERQAPDVSAFAWSALAPRYRAMLEKTALRGRRDWLQTAESPDAGDRPERP